MTNDLLAKIAEQEKEIEKLRSENKRLKEGTLLLPESDEVLFTVQDMIALLPANIFWKNMQGHYLGCNNNLAKFLGFDSPKDIIGKRNCDFMAENYAQQIEYVDDELTKSGQDYMTIEEEGLDVNGNPTTFLSQKILLRTRSDKVFGLLGVSFDITERKKMEMELKIAKERAEASSRAKSQFLAVVNHELRTPVASIVGLLNFLKQVNLPIHEEKNILEALENCTHHLLGLINDVLDFSKLETCKYNIRFNIVNLNSILTEVCGILKTLASNKGLNLVACIDSQVPENIFTDSRVLKQILINLVNNAIKFTDSGEIKIHISLIDQRSTDCALLEFAVSDTGPGIPEDKLALIFEPFQQLEDAYTRQSSRSGTGLGLTIVEKLAELLNAKIAVSSKIGQGSTFSIMGEFQTREITPTEAAPSNIASIKQAKNKVIKLAKTLDLSKPHILLIEDDPIVQYVHCKMLNDLGCHVDAVASGLEALGKVENHDLIFVDISLPDMNGFEVIKAIRQRLDKTKDIPIIALTVYTGTEEKAASLRAGANDFASKPISERQLAKLIKKYVDTVNNLSAPIAIAK